MITLRRAADRGHADHGWLDTYHTFSFAGYHDPCFMGCGPLRVLNQDRILPGQGFGTHGHENMEIITYVLDGVIEHRDSLGSGARMGTGEVQLMSAGTGVTHSEFNGSAKAELHLLQMWVLPEKRDTEPSYEQRPFPREERLGRLQLLACPDGRDGSLTMGQDVELFAAILGPGQEVEVPLATGRTAWLHLARGEMQLNGEALASGDGAAVVGETALHIRGTADAEFVLFNLPS